MIAFLSEDPLLMGINLQTLALLAFPEGLAGLS